MKRCWKIRFGLFGMLLLLLSMVGVYAWMFHREGIKMRFHRWQCDRLRSALMEANPEWDGKDFLASGLPPSVARLPIPAGGIVRAWSIIYVDLSTSALADISPLSEYPIEELKLDCGKLESLEALRGLPLKELRLLCFDRPSPLDLSPLQDAPLERFALWEAMVEDLTPLKGAPLQSVVMFGTDVEDLSPLKGAPIQFISLVGTYVRDLSPLKGAPLRTVRLEDTPAMYEPLPTWLQQRVDKGVCRVTGHVGPDGRPKGTFRRRDR